MGLEVAQEHFIIFGPELIFLPIQAITGGLRHILVPVLFQPILKFRKFLPMYSLRKITKFCLIFSILLQPSFLKKVFSGANFRFFELKAIICMKIDHLFLSLINSGPLLRMGLFFQTSIIKIYQASSPVIQKFILGLKFWALNIIFSKQNFRLEILGDICKAVI